MMLTASALLLLLLGPGIGAVPSRLWEHQGSSRCVPIPSNMALCQGLGYNSMRIPNLLGHESPAEAVQQSTSWLPLLARECHPHAAIFCARSSLLLCLRLNSSSSVLTMFSLGSRLEVLKHGPLLGGEMRSRLTLWLERDATCVGNLTRNHPDGGTFLLTGTVTGKRLLVTKAFSWGKRQRHLNQAARKWKSHRCRG
ncbi:hypothetical protein cypCar_00017089 [Cyprinus carpio]|nr:hypothetical protein cypCar_00017089 [Cyprinus carpio]